MNVSPEDYLEAAVIAREAGSELLLRLDLMAIKPKVIVDMGSGAGVEASQLQTLYPDANIISLDKSYAMLSHAQQRNAQCVQAHAERLPFADQSIDIIFANMLLPWQSNLEFTFKEWRRVMKDEGLILFTALGPDTLKAYRAQFSNEMPSMVDMHDIGDLLMQCGFSDPVLDVSYITLSYQDPKKFIREMIASHMFQTGNEATLISPIHANFEIIYGHAFAQAESETAQVSSDGIAYFPLHKLKKKMAFD